eukprot:COSAG02_NODE_29229_length_573_cov_1.392405_1_plen_21_part_01
MNGEAVSDDWEKWLGKLDQSL